MRRLDGLDILMRENIRHDIVKNRAKVVKVHHKVKVRVLVEEGRSMTRFLIYLFPAVADVIIAATMFVCSNRLADAGRSRTEVAMVFASWAVLYIASNQILARLVTSRNAAAMLNVANLLFTATAGAFVF